MKFDQKLQSGLLIQRYKRFLADIEVEKDGKQPKVLTIHCPNTGAMTGCNVPGSRVWFSTSDNAKRKYPNTWELLETLEGDWACINTVLANKLVEEAINADVIEALKGYSDLSREVRYGDEKSRIDLLLSNPEKDRRDCYIEVKSVTLLTENHIGMFPDAVSARGQKHLRELMAMVEAGHRAVLFFCVNHTGIKSVRPADHIDPEYGQLLRQAAARGVEILAYGADISDTDIVLTRQLPVQLNAAPTLSE
ncbi:DNA/RNA nuclease SfsA [Alkalimarinus alittae]|uniref:Sugar fermentation stimulation protein homolog n=1 Tax=Alkalimarinus alittae TaxID=2961619 RepID=A0ABY6N194_9ALTE|nr:DNA/RNA nuclease SfsA [Alkalimarinus alittae]UZE95870.1 DNA/RNA nuclease SfsA [Alkalimarinus alittae]